MKNLEKLIKALILEYAEVEVFEEIESSLYAHCMMAIHLFQYGDDYYVDFAVVVFNDGTVEKIPINSKSSHRMREMSTILVYYLENGGYCAKLFFFHKGETYTKNVLISDEFDAEVFESIDNANDNTLWLEQLYENS